MHITDDKDRVIEPYRPILDNEIDFDAPFIDFKSKEINYPATVPYSGVYDTLFYEKEKILIVNNVCEIEIRFYSSETPDEDYRVGQRHMKGRVLDIKKNEDESGNSIKVNNGFTLKFDVSKQWYGKIKKVNVNKKYVETTHTRCIAILYFNDRGRVTHELVIPIVDWFSSKCYLNSAFIVTDPEPYPFVLDDVVDVVAYLKTNIDGKTTIIEKEFTGRLDKISLIQRDYIEEDANKIAHTKTTYYYRLLLDLSEEYMYDTLSIASTVIKHISLHHVPPVEL